MDALAHGSRINRNAARNKEALATITPFVKQFEGWHTRSALIHARLLAGRGDVGRARLDLDALIAEVMSGYETFKASIASAPGHGRIDDVDHTFQRLLQSLRGTIVSKP